MIRLISAYPCHDTLRRLDQARQPIPDYKIWIGDEQYSWKALIFQPLISILEISPRLIEKIEEKNLRSCRIEDIFAYYLAKWLELSATAFDILELSALAKHYNVDLQLPEEYIGQLKDLYLIPSISVDDKKIIRAILKLHNIIIRVAVSKATSPYDYGFNIFEEDDKKLPDANYSRTA